MLFFRGWQVKLCSKSPYEVRSGVLASSPQRRSWSEGTTKSHHPRTTPRGSINHLHMVRLINYSLQFVFFFSNFIVLDGIKVCFFFANVFFFSICWWFGLLLVWILFVLIFLCFLGLKMIALGMHSEWQIIIVLGQIRLWRNARQALLSIWRSSTIGYAVFHFGLV